MSPAARLLARFQHPAQIVAVAFAAAIAVGTTLLALPVATAPGESTGALTALFTATTAVCITGLATVDTASHWSPFGQVVILVLMQAGGLGIMTLATLFALLVSGRLGLRARMLAQAETKALQGTGLRRVVRNIVLFSLCSEAVVAAVLGLRLALAYDEPAARAAYLGIFHAVSAFNNGGLALWPDSMMRFVADPWVLLPVALAVVLGGLGFPVVFELVRAWRRPKTWTVLTRITLGVSAALLAGGTLLFTIVEWHNPRTLGPLPDQTKFLAGFFTAVMPRSGGLNAIDISQMRPESWLATDILMFIGAGSAGTGGGIKVTTFGLLAFVMWAELRGEDRVNVGHRRLAGPVQRQALTIALLSVGLVALGTFVLLSLVPYALDRVLLEVVSAFGTVGLSTGITPHLPPGGQLLLVALMFVGRVGPLTVFSALALRERTRRYELPEERPIVG
ncbi:MULTISPECIES: TrkH family potassium uptake protein [Thermomonospora]|uniref:H(+)-transporting two-sector ATPase n=1 Tax=Thermomonospora curvata (strain ATCC 19995 / DSM 43183 / JCM 3096 / KCTC 9072 / NBRC 15933 / NCIMB 10081 / Henssen B9) TaxID=471852 RepID=D1AC18_THECD|nr:MULTISPECIES: potassium transporter TrkG [Thermomonospora]ACY97284.1 H(+)-transporting two-sector ATPase [Thermomonospora curvata DSM 43183]PKK14652.1 MAG: ATPase [Thermomonospora sp. CIF 1]